MLTPSPIHPFELVIVAGLAASVVLMLALGYLAFRAPPIRELPRNVRVPSPQPTLPVAPANTRMSLREWRRLRGRKVSP